MDLIELLILGFVQGITEFLPISSSGHLWIIEELIFNNKSSIELEVILHLATLLAVLLFFRKKIYSLIYNFITISKNNDFFLSLKLLTSTVITGVIAINLTSYFNIINKELVSITLIFTAVLILISEFFYKKNNHNKFSWNIAFFLGIIQAIAIIPGISRSGITIAFLIIIGLDKKKSLELSFLLSIPTILASFIFVIPTSLKINEINIYYLLLGGFTAFFTAFFTIVYLSKYIHKIWKWFSLWCIAISLIVYFYL
jgi:undecaprenyl-diphosphatase